MSTLDSSPIEAPTTAFASRRASLLVAAILTVAQLAILLWRFAPYIQLTSFDLAQHYVLIDELMKYGGVRAGNPTNLGSMIHYPPLAHWLAVIIGRISGSGLTGMTIAAIGSLFASYLLICSLVRRDNSAALPLFAGLFAAAIWTHSLIGWEIVGNFFYPQLVGDAVYFAVLLWLCRDWPIVMKIACIASLGCAAMWLQPLTALHILGTGCAIFAFDAICDRSRKHAAAFVILACCAVPIILLNPEYRFMKQIAQWNGGLDFGYPHVMLVAFLGLCVGILTLIGQLKTRDRTSIVLGAALVSAAGLAILQFILWKCAHNGSPYAVKKHMFIVVTLSLMNMARLAGARISSMRRLEPYAPVVASIVAGVSAWMVLSLSFTSPLTPIVDAISYANHAVRNDDGDLTRGRAADADTSQSPFVNTMISLSSFEYPWGDRAIRWLDNQETPGAGARYRMALKSSIVGKCDDRMAEGARYVLVGPDCEIR